MLERSDDPRLGLLEWEALEPKPQIPSNLNDFFKRRGPGGIHADCRRRYARLYLRRPAILQRQDGTRLAAYSIDVSRTGIGLLSPVQMLPGDVCSVRLPETRWIPIQVMRCRRLARQAYVCGAVFERADEVRIRPTEPALSNGEGPD